MIRDTNRQNAWSAKRSEISGQRTEVNRTHA
jgi:hypothetical protein